MAPTVPPRDYVSPGLEVVHPDRAFPNMVAGDVECSAWPYLQRHIAHTWYVDRRWPTVGFVSRDEAAIVHHTARLFEGRPCLEIGCWRGWSTAHMALAAHSVDVLDPVLADPAVTAEIESALAALGVADRVTLIGRPSPEGVEEIVGRTGKRWSFAFIDGDHDGDAPVRDVAMVSRHLAADALILLHDLAAPGPAAALAYLRDKGWTTAVYQTMQFMGVATRGACTPVAHLPDPTQTWRLPDHLTTFAVVGEPMAESLRRVTVALGGVDPAAPAGEDDQAAAERALVETALRTAARLTDELQQLRQTVTALERDVEAGRRFEDLHTRFVQLVTASAAQAARLGSAEAELASTRGQLQAARAEADRAGAEVGRLGTLLQRATRALAVTDRPAAGGGVAAEVVHVRHEAQQLRQQLAQAQAESSAVRTAADASRAAIDHGDRIDSFAHALGHPRILFGLARRSAMGRHDEVRGRLADAFASHGASKPLPESAIAWLVRTRTLVGLLRRAVLSGSASSGGLLAAALRMHAVADVHPSAVAAGPLPEPRHVAQLREQLDQATAEAARERQHAADLDGKRLALERTLASESHALYIAQIEIATLKQRAVASLGPGAREPDR